MQVVIQFFKEMSPAKLAAAGLTIFAFLVMFIVFVTRVNSSEFAVLYADLDVQDSAKVAEELDNRKVPYQVVADGSIIKVHKSEVANARLFLAQSGLPNSGSVVGYEIFDEEDSIGATNFSQNIRLVRALEGELSRTISAFDQISKARVHLVMPQREIFSKERTEPRASVVLKLKGHKKLGKSEIEAISQLVVTSVPNLEMKSVTIVDTKGRALKIGSSEDSEGYGGGKHEEVRVAEENRLKKVIEELISSSTGVGKVKARVALDMNFDRIVTNSESYDPDGAVVRSVQSIDEKEQTPVSGSSGGVDASVANNIPGGSGGSDDNASKFAIVEKSDQTTNYEISKVIKNHISESGIINRMSIGILVDGTYKIDPETRERIYTPRSQEYLDQIARVVKNSVGFDEDRGDKIDIINTQFSSEFDILEDDSDWIKDELPGLFQTLVFAIVVLLVLITVIRPIAMKAFEVRRQGTDGDVDTALEALSPIEGDGAGSSAAPGVAGATPGTAQSSAGAAPSGDGSVPGSDAGPQAEKKADPVAKINDMADSSPQDLVNVLRKWLNEV